MTVTNARLAETRSQTDQNLLRGVIEALAPLERLAGSDGEREAAEWIAARLNQAGAPAGVDEERFDDGYAGMIGRLAAIAAAAGAVGVSGHGRRLASGVAAAATALIADDISNGLRPWRKATMERKPTWNVVAEAGDPAAERTLVVMAHHDAARTGQIFDDTVQKLLGEHLPGVVERIDTSLPLWWPLLAGPASVAVGTATRRRKLAVFGTLASALGAAVMADIERSPVVPGANDNLSAVAVLVALAEALQRKPVQGLRVVLASCGAEEVLQGGVYAFCQRHLAPLDREQTWMLNLDTVGSPGLVLLEGEGAIVMEDFFDRTWRDLIVAVAERERIPMRRGMRARTSTDSVVPSRMGIPTACLVSINRYKGLSNYHQMSDTPEKVSYPTVACAADLAEALVRELAAPEQSSRSERR
ncbi:MAG: M28 family peptidase [Solirubrobacterales bacterium]